MGSQNRAWRLSTLPALLIGLSALAQSAPAAETAPPSAKWAEILGPSQGKPPAPQEKVVWRADLPAAMQEADARTGRCSSRCGACRASSARRSTRRCSRAGRSSTRCSKQFVTVRLTDARRSTCGCCRWRGSRTSICRGGGGFLSPAGAGVRRVRRAGQGLGRDADLPAPPWRRRWSACWRTPIDPRRGTWDVDGPAPELGGRARDAEGPARLSHRGRRGGPEVKAAACIHCHQVAEILRQPAVDAEDVRQRAGPAKSGRCRRTSGWSWTATTGCW